MDYKEKTIICKDCNKSFVLTVGEQKFYDGKGLSYPIRCKECRELRKTKEPAKAKEPAKRTCDENLVSKKAMTPEEIEAVLAKWRENTVYFSEVDMHNRHHSTTKRK